jgi:magnesium chelatase family protein
MSFARVYGAQPALPKAHIVSIETDISRGLHAFSIVGLPDKAVEEARDRLSAAIKHSGFTSPKSTNKKIIVSLAPASLKKEGSAFDLPAALSYLAAAEDIEFDPEKKLFAGELSLDGALRPIRGVLSMALAARDQGFTEMYVPKENASEAALVGGITVFGAGSLLEIVNHLRAQEQVLKDDEEGFDRLGAFIKEPIEVAAPTYEILLEHIRGQTHAKRGIEIAAAGGHNIALSGPPGTGKTMLARALASLMPALSEEEVIEVTSIHSYAGVLETQVVTHPPFRAPHHTASYASLIGGGTIPKPGEVTLAHRGILFLDEFPEFNRDVINALRQPMEDRVVSVTRVRGQALFPASFTLVAALNPCPCGYWGTTRCTCNPAAADKYRRKISGPIADRIDMWITVGEIPPASLLGKNSDSTGETTAARDRIGKAREVQRVRFSRTRNTLLNSGMKAKDIEDLAQLSDAAGNTLTKAASTLRLSPRGFHRTIKLARTIADLDASQDIEERHRLEALQYRQRDI